MASSLARSLGSLLPVLLPFVAAASGLLACDHGKAPAQDPSGSPSAPMASASSSSAATSPPTASASATPSSSAAGVAPTASAKAPLVVPSTWTPFAHKKLALSFSYPKDVFTLSEPAGKIVLTSALSRDELGGDPKPKKWVYGATLFVVPGTPEAYFQKDWKPFWTDANPGGKFKETESLATTTVSGKSGYALFAGVEGYNTRVLAVARGKETVVIQLRTIGDVMGPKPPEADQSHTFDVLLSSLRIE